MSLGWGLNFQALACGIFESLSSGFFSRYSSFLPPHPPLLKLMVTTNEKKAKINAMSTLSNLLAGCSFVPNGNHQVSHGKLRSEEIVNSLDLRLSETSLFPLSLYSSSLVMTWSTPQPQSYLLMLGRMETDAIKVIPRTSKVALFDVMRHLLDLPPMKTRRRVEQDKHASTLCRIPRIHSSMLLKKKRRVD